MERPTVLWLHRERVAATPQRLGGCRMLGRSAGKTHARTAGVGRFQRHRRLLRHRRGVARRAQGDTSAGKESRHQTFGLARLQRRQALARLPVPNS